MPDKSDGARPDRTGAAYSPWTSTPNETVRILPVGSRSDLEIAARRLTAALATTVAVAGQLESLRLEFSAGGVR